MLLIRQVVQLSVCCVTIIALVREKISYYYFEFVSDILTEF